MAGINLQLVADLVVGIHAVVGELTIANQSWKHHEGAVSPKLMLPAGGMPEAAVAGPGIAVKARPHVAGSDSVLRQPGFLEQIKQYNDRLHAVQTAEAVVDVAAAVHEPGCPRLNKWQRSWVPGALKHQIRSVKIHSYGE